MIRALRLSAILLGVFALLCVIVLGVADTSIGHRMIADRIAAQTPKSGLRIKIGRIDGSIFHQTRLRDLQLYDARGLFFDSGDVRLTWNPTAWLVNRLDISSLTVPVATLHRLPKLKPSTTNGPILPGFDIRIDKFAITKLDIDAGVAGAPRSGRLSGKADINDGRALVQLDARASAGDRLTLKLDAEPDRDRFDVDVDLAAPAGGIFGAVIGTAKPVSLSVKGDGRWKAWRGQLLASVSQARIADFSLTAVEGKFALGGLLALQSITTGKVQRLTSPLVRVTGDATLENRRLNSRLTLSSPQIVVRSEGVSDLANNRFSAMRIKARLLVPNALFPNMSGGPVDLQAMLDGPFATARFDYLLTAPRVAFDNTGFEAVRASGQGRFSKSPVTVPVKLFAARVTGVGDVAGGILAGLSVNGNLKVTKVTLSGDGLLLKSDKLSGKLSLLVDLKTGRFDVGLAGQLGRYLIPGLGIVDVKTELKVVPSETGRGTRVIGRGQAWVRRLDNSFLAGLTKGLPQIDTGLTRGPDGLLHFVNLRLTSPGIALSGNGYRRIDGSFFFEGAGKQAVYGPITRMVLDGRIERPRIDLLLARPNDAMGLAGVHVLLDPNPAGFAWRADGNSTLGRFVGNGSIALPSGQPAIMNIASLNASGLNASGALRSLTGGFDGRLNVAGNGVSGALDFKPQNAIQQIEAHLKMRDAALKGPPAIIIRRGTVDGIVLLDPRGTSVEATVTGQGLSRGGISLARLAANAKLRGGVGEVRASFAGSRGRSFDFQTMAQVSPGAVKLIGTGTIDRKPLTLLGPALFTKEGDGWRLQPAGVRFAGGQAKVGGLFGGSRPEISAELMQMPLTVLDMFYPKLALGGVGSGTLSYRNSAGQLPSGAMNLRVRGLTRSGLVLSSKPVNVGINAVLSGTSAAVRAVAVSEGQTIARGQARLSPPPGGDLTSRLGNAPMLAQLRASGGADTLWRLIGVETIDVSGPIAVAADITGTPNNPQIRGSLSTNNGRIESPVTGMVLTGVMAQGRFGGSSLVIDNFSANAGKDGKLTGKASFSISAADGFGMNIDAQASNATLIARDDLGATITGPLRIKSDASGGLISGDVILNRSSYRLGKATAAAAIPTLNVKEINRINQDEATRGPARPWQLAIKARAPNRAVVTGLGIDSEWRADLDIGGTVLAPAITGRANLVRGGYEFAGRRFDLTRGQIRFLGEVPADPVLDILANGDTQGLSASIHVSGTGLKPEITFASTPALPQDELLSRLLFGTSITNLSAPEAVQLAAAVASLRGGGNGLNPINALRNAIGLDRLRILPADTVTGQRTSIAAGKYITRRAYVEIITDGQGYSATRAEFQITRWLSLLSSISTIGRQSATVRVSKDY